jgi:U3 small nucleolar RNA-associated protein 7
MESEGELDKTFRVTQREIRDAVDLQSRDKIFDLRLTEFGPYLMEYSRDGRFLLLAGQKGTFFLRSPVTTPRTHFAFRLE